jgi:mono/diheme cytochrome c family protein
MKQEIHALIMKKAQFLAVVCLLSGTAGLFGQTPAKGDKAKGKVLFDQQCGLCHDPMTTETRMYKRPTLKTTGKPTNDANVLDKINNGGNGMTPFKDMNIPAADMADLLAYLRTL